MAARPKSRSLKTDSSGSTFIARSAHPLLKSIQWSHTDIQVLDSQVSRDVQNAAIAYSGDKWTPAYEVELKCYQSRRSHERDFHIQVEFSVSPVMLDTERPPSNRGERAVLRKGSPATIVECDFGAGLDHAETLKGPLTAETMREMRFIQDTPAGRSVARANTDVTEACAAIERTLARFAEKLGTAVGPSRADPERLPTPQDLADFMAEAARDVSGNGS